MAWSHLFTKVHTSVPTVGLSSWSGWSFLSWKRTRPRRAAEAIYHHCKTYGTWTHNYSRAHANTQAICPQATNAVSDDRGPRCQGKSHVHACGLCGSTVCDQVCLYVCSMWLCVLFPSCPHVFRDMMSMWREQRSTELSHGLQGASTMIKRPLGRATKALPKQPPSISQSPLLYRSLTCPHEFKAMFPKGPCTDILYVKEWKLWETTSLCHWGRYVWF